MKLDLSRRTAVVLAGSLALAVATSGPARAQERTKAKDALGPERAKADERASGVIVKVEPLTPGSSSGSTSDDDSKRDRNRRASRRLTINTAAVWRDWVRDQAESDPSGSTKSAAEKGANSVATKGEPASPDTLVVVDIGPETRIETRYRASTDETSRGSSSPAQARAGGTDPAEKDGAKSEPGKAKRVAPDDLKPGLFVEVDFRHATARNIASTVSVLRPVGGPDTPASK